MIFLDPHSDYYIVSNRLQVIITNRLVLNLSKSANTREGSEFHTKTTLEPPIFAMGIPLGNIGGSVNTLPDDFYDEGKESSAGGVEEFCEAMVNQASTSAIELGI